MRSSSQAHTFFIPIFLLLTACGGGGGGNEPLNISEDVTQSNDVSVQSEVPTQSDTNVVVIEPPETIPSVAGFYTILATEDSFICTNGPALENPFGPTADNVIVTQSQETIAIEYSNQLELRGTIDSDGIFEASSREVSNDVLITYDLSGVIEESGYWSGQLIVTLEAAFEYTCVATPFFSGRRGDILSPQPFTPTPTPTPGECIDTAPLNDGFGWNGVETCSLPVTPSTTPFVDRNCSDFTTQAEAQNFFENNGANDPHVLDLDNDELACECNVGGGGWAWCPVPVITPVITPPNTPFVDRNCSDFTTQAEAQAFFEREGGPTEDPHRLDGDGDGRVCVSLP